jgi:hypothetical protein
MACCARILPAVAAWQAKGGALYPPCPVHTTTLGAKKNHNGRAHYSQPSHAPLSQQAVTAWLSNRWQLPLALTCTTACAVSKERLMQHPSGAELRCCRRLNPPRNAQPHTPVPTTTASPCR